MGDEIRGGEEANHTKSHVDHDKDRRFILSKTSSRWRISAMQSCDAALLLIRSFNCCVES